MKWAMIVLMLAGVAWADEPQIVNKGGVSSCACALAGKEGACFITADVVKLRNAAAIELPGCKTTLSAREAENTARSDALKASQAQVALLSSSIADLKSALGAREKQVEELTKAARYTPPTSTSRVLWALIGGAVGVAATIGVVYALRPAKIGTVSSALHPMVWR